MYYISGTVIRPMNNNISYSHKVKLWQHTEVKRIFELMNQVIINSILQEFNKSFLGGGIEQKEVLEKKSYSLDKQLPE